MTLSATCVWHVDGRLVLALDATLGPPVDSYVNGSQTWLAEDGPNGITLEWRLHPVAEYQLPGGLSHYDLWEEVVGALSCGVADADLPLGTARRAIATLWDGLECFPAYGDEVEPAPLAAAAGGVIGRAPDASGLVDHERVGRAWEQAPGRVSIASMLFEELAGDMTG
jgi:hypothetical protein